MIPAEEIPKEWLDEWKHVYQTRLGAMCGDAKPTHDEHMIAMREATEHVKRLAK